VHTGKYTKKKKKKEKKRERMVVGRDGKTIAHVMSIYTAAAVFSLLSSLPVYSRPRAALGSLILLAQIN
jgi:hypothetical protein